MCKLLSDLLRSFLWPNWMREHEEAFRGYHRFYFECVASPRYTLVSGQKMMCHVVTEIKKLPIVKVACMKSRPVSSLSCRFIQFWTKCNASIYSCSIILRSVVLWQGRTYHRHSSAANPVTARLILTNSLFHPKPIGGLFPGWNY